MTKKKGNSHMKFFNDLKCALAIVGAVISIPSALVCLVLGIGSFNSSCYAVPAELVRIRTDAAVACYGGYEYTVELRNVIFMDGPGQTILTIYEYDTAFFSKHIKKGHELIVSIDVAKQGEREWILL